MCLMAFQLNSCNVYVNGMCGLTALGGVTAAFVEYYK